MSLTAKEMYFQAALCGNTNLLSKYIDFMKLSRNQHGQTALMIAAANNRFEAVKLLIPFEQGKFSVSGDSALMLAAKNNAVESVKMFINSEEVNLINPQSGYTALMYASKHKDGTITQLLVKEARKFNHFNQTALNLALQVGNLNSALLLLEFEKDQNNEYHQPPLFDAIRYGMHQLFELLSTSVQDSVGNSALHQAVLYSNMQAIEMFKHLDLLNNAGESGLMYSIKLNASVQQATLLCHQSGQYDKFGCSASHFAVFFGKKDLVNLVLEAEKNIESFSGAVDFDLIDNYDERLVCELQWAALRQKKSLSLLEAAAIRGDKAVLRLTIELLSQRERKIQSTDILGALKVLLFGDDADLAEIVFDELETQIREIGVQVLKLIINSKQHDYFEKVKFVDLNLLISTELVSFGFLLQFLSDDAFEINQEQIRLLQKRSDSGIYCYQCFGFIRDELQELLQKRGIAEKIPGFYD